MSRYRWVRCGPEILRDVGILDDGTLHNPRGYPDDVVRAAVQAADGRRTERRRNGAKKAAATRQRRHELRVRQIAARIVASGSIGNRCNCALCGRGLTDPESVARGIGSECWQDVLRAVEERRVRP
jgi:hypothetical protein